jgi:HTH-type transcriptional regulator/antitoxin HigA
MTPQPLSPVPVQAIRDPAEHEAAMAEVAALWGAARGTAKGDLLDALATAIDAYEAHTYPMGNEAA